MSTTKLKCWLLQVHQCWKGAVKYCGRNGVFDLVQSSLDTDTTCETFDELLQNMVESKAVKLRTVGGRECLSLPKEKADLEVFQ